MVLAASVAVEADVGRIGTESIAGDIATRYGVDLTDRSRAAFSDPVLGLPSDMERLEVWVADDQLRRIMMTTASGSETVYTYFHIGADISLAEPQGDITPDPEPIGFLYDRPRDAPR